MFFIIIYIREINLQNSYAVLIFVDHLIDILKAACRTEELTAKMEILNRIHIALPSAAMAIRIPVAYASSIFERDIFICSCSAQLISFEIDSISKKINCA